MEDERPICPSQEYLSQQQNTKERIVMHQTNFLKRSNGKYLPCFSDSRLRSNTKEEKPKPSKRELYQKIKSKNQAMYGKNNKKKMKQSTEPQSIKKPKPKRKNYSALQKQKIIQTQQINLKSPIVKHSSTRKVVSSNTNYEERNRYQRLIKQIQKQRQVLQKQRQQFEQERLLLEFRKEIKDQDGIKSKKVNQRKSQRQHPQIYYSRYLKNQNSPNMNSKIINSQRKGLKVGRAVSQKRSFKSDLVQSKKLIQNISQKLILMEQSRKQREEKREATLKSSKKQNKIELEDLPSIPNFNIDVFNSQASQDILIHNHNKFYLQFLNRQKNLKTKGAIQSQHGKKSSQIIKYSDGSFTKEAKKYRLIEFPNGYKLTIFQNHDVKQQFPGGMLSYYSKSKQVNKISFDSSFDIYYFYRQKQIQIHYKPSCRKEIRYHNGAKRTVIDPQ